MGGSDVSYAGFRKLTRQSGSQQGEIGAACDAHQQMEVFAAFRFAHKNGMEGFV
jgi:hypothetical protein